MILPTPWGHLREHDRVLAPDLTIWHVLRPVLPGVATLHHRPTDRRSTLQFTTQSAPAQLLLEPEDTAVRLLRRHFTLDWIEDR